jgi:phospholipase B1
LLTCKFVVGTFKVSAVFPLTAGQSYCVPNGFIQNTGECSCSSSAENLAKMDTLSDGNITCINICLQTLVFNLYNIAYNAKLQAIADKYKGTANGTFAVMYSPAPIDISTFPVDALR